MVFVTANISLNDDELHYTAIRAGGPGGQHVNTTNSAVQLKFNAASSPAIKPDVFTRLKTLAGQRMSNHGVILIEASEHRSQLRNREAAHDRLIELIRAAAVPPKHRKKTRPTRGSKERRLGDKSRISGLKKARTRVKPDD